MKSSVSARLVLVAAAAIVAAACAADPGAVAPPPPGHEQGLEIVGIQLLAGGDLAKLEYRVRDIEKARAALAGEVALVSEGGATLSVMSVGRLGPMRQRPSTSGKLQFILFTNPGRRIQRGEKVILTLGEDRIAGITVS